MALPWNCLQHRLSQFEFEALFCEELGWQVVYGPILESLSHPDLNKVWAAQADDVHGVILVQGQIQEAAAPLAFHTWLGQFSQVYSDPLVIWVTLDGQRSLWCWLSPGADQPYWQTTAVIRGQGNIALAVRLLSLQLSSLAQPSQLGDWLGPAAAISSPDLRAGFLQSWQTLNQALHAISSMDEREHYAMVLLCRLIAITGLQRQGYLGKDEWYLHNQFGQSQQQGQNQFFQKVLQPLWHQGFTLPPEERPLTIQQGLETVPFLPTSPFSSHELDRRWGHLPIADAAFEPVLTWLGDWLMATHHSPLDVLLDLGEWWINCREGMALVTPGPMLQTLCDRTLHATVLDWATSMTGQAYRSVDQLLMAIEPHQAAKLLDQVGQVTVLDPACGSGRFLVAALQHLTTLACTLRGIADLHRQTPVPSWAQAASQDSSPSPKKGMSDILGLHRHLLTHSLYGVDLWPPAVELTRLQLFLQAVEHTHQAQDLIGLPDLTLTILPGNSLIGLVRVEAERFDQVPAKSRRRSPIPPTSAEKPLQGNLLQPLLADTYQDVLAERQVRLEHYRSQTQLLAEAGSVPDYAQAEFWRDRIQELNHIAQEKLTHLLWNECSQQLGIRVQYQDAEGSRQSRLLELADIDRLGPFHWGFYFHQLLQNREGFDVILSHFPTGSVQATGTDFVARHPDLLQGKGIAPSTLLQNRKQVLAIDRDIHQAWCDYRSTFSFPNQYFRRSRQYTHATQASPERAQGRLHWSRLFLERSLQLLRDGGRCGVVLDPFWNQASSAPLRQWLQTRTHLETILDLSNQGELWPDLPARTTLCLLWLRAQGLTPASPYSAHIRRKDALTPGTLGHTLQGLVDLLE